MFNPGTEFMVFVDGDYVLGTVMECHDEKAFFNVPFHDVVVVPISSLKSQL